MSKEYILQKQKNGMHYIVVEPKLVNSFLKKGSKRAICKLNDAIEFHSAFLTRKEGENFIYIGSRICKKLKIKEGSKLKAEFYDDTSTYQFEMPEELESVFKKDKKANEIFQSLTKGNQRGLIYLITLVKTNEKRHLRAVKIAEGLKKGITSAKMILNQKK
jgi:hypothetical protein